MLKGACYLYPKDFSIQISNVSETSESEADSDEPPVLTWQRSSAIPTSDDIDQLVKGLRKDSEVCVCNIITNRCYTLDI